MASFLSSKIMLDTLWLPPCNPQPTRTRRTALSQGKSLLSAILLKTTHLWFTSSWRSSMSISTTKLATLKKSYIFQMAVQEWADTTQFLIYNEARGRNPRSHKSGFSVIQKLYTFDHLSIFLPFLLFLFNISAELIKNTLDCPLYPFKLLKITDLWAIKCVLRV